jgi:peptidyl-prolyl cis-trans isomerase A (cyclophilin A)
MLNSLEIVKGALTFWLGAAMILAAVAAVGVGPANAKSGNPVVVMETTKGTIKIELFAKEAPKSVENFLWYVDHEFYDGLIFHRVMDNFMIQGGGFTKDLVKKRGNPAIENEAHNGLKNDRGTLAMARTPDINSATSQFFINLKDNAFLNHRGKTRSDYGYAVFGKVVEGLEVIDAIAKVKVVDKEGHEAVPATAVVIKKAYQSTETAKKKPKDKVKESSNKE